MEGHTPMPSLLRKHRVSFVKDAASFRFAGAAAPLPSNAIVIELQSKGCQ